MGIGVERYAAVFLDNGVELDSLALLSESDLEKLWGLLCHRRNVLKAPAELLDAHIGCELSAALARPAGLRGVFYT